MADPLRDRKQFVQIVLMALMGSLGKTVSCSACMA